MENEATPYKRLADTTSKALTEVAELSAIVDQLQSYCDKHNCSVSCENRGITLSIRGQDRKYTIGSRVGYIGGTHVGI